MTTKKQIEQRRAAAAKNVTHGLYAFRDGGERTLSPGRYSMYQELKALFDSDQGRVEYRSELATHLAMMLELGFADLRKRAEDGKNIWEAPQIKSMGIYTNSLIRLIDGWPKDQEPPKDITTILKGGTDGD